MLQANVELDARTVKKVVEIYYDIQVNKIKKVRAAYRLETEKGVFAFKNAKKLSDLSFIQTVIHHLHQNGFPRIPRILPTFDGQELISYKKHLYYVEEWFTHVKEVNPQKWDWLSSAGKALAEYHQVIATFDTSKIPANRLNKKSWKGWIYDQSKKIEQLSAVFSNSAYFDDYQQYFKQKCQWSMQLCDQKMTQAVLCHGSLHNENIMIDHKKTTWLIDYERMVWDEKVRDIAQLLDYHFRHHDWNESHLLLFLEGYQQVQPLKQAEINALCARLICPRRLFRYFYAIFDPAHPRLEDINRLNKRIQKEQKKEHVLKQVFAIP